MYYLYGSRAGAPRRLVATFDSEAQLLAYVPLGDLVRVRRHPRDDREEDYFGNHVQGVHGPRLEGGLRRTRVAVGSLTMRCSPDRRSYAFIIVSKDAAALVTGSGKKRVGWHVADALAGRGYDIAVHYRTSAKEAAETVEHLRSRGVEAVAFQADLAEESAVRDLVRGVQDHFGRLDVLVNCAAVYKAKAAGGSHRGGRAPQFRGQSPRHVPCAQQAGLAMVRQPEGGCIVNFGDWASRGRTSTMPPTSSARGPSRL